MSHPLDPSLRQIINTSPNRFRPYDRYGTANPDIDWLPLSGNAEEGYESFLIRMKPGGSSTPHEHTGFEEFLVLEGEMEDCDGTVMKAGDFVSYQPGSKHFSKSPKGCLLLVVLTGQNRAIDT
ncbi:MAG: cupin domain-containing protein [Gammaproteobacteria bacterium]|nr:cupin domain-containing protein [Gammaproteobacteria bacterium]